MTSTFGPQEASQLLEDVFAPWVQALDLTAVSLGKDGSRFIVPENADLSLNGGPGKGLVCGQAAAAIADTAAVLTLSGANGRFRICTTLDMTTSYLRPLRQGELEVEGTILSNGRKTAVCRIDIREAGAQKTSVTANCTFMYLED